MIDSRMICRDCAVKIDLLKQYENSTLRINSDWCDEHDNCQGCGKNATHGDLREVDYFLAEAKRIVKKSW